MDGIYPELERFLKTISVPLTKIDRNISLWQESKRKDIERGFGVLQSKFHFLVHAIQMHHHDDIFYAVKACIAMHNMTVEVRINEHQEKRSLFYEVVQDQLQEQSFDAPVDSVEAEVDREDTCLFS